MKKSKKRKIGIIQMSAFFVAAIVFYEYVLIASYGKSFDFSIHSLNLIFSFSFGFFITFMLSLIGGERANFVSGLVILSVLSLIYLIETLLVRSYGYFYPIETIFSMSGQVIFGFGGSVLLTIASNAKYIFFYSLPIVFYIFLRSRHKIVIKHRIRVPLAVISCAFVFHSLSTIAIYNVKSETTTLSNYTYAYDFNNAVKNFGLLTTMRLNLKQTFVTDENNKIYTLPKKTVENTNTDSGKVAKIFDFEKLATKTSDKATLRLCEYYNNIEPTTKNEYSELFGGKNVVLICAEAFSPHVISKELTPTLYKLSTNGFVFDEFYQPSFGESTLGGEYAILLSQVPKKDAGESGLSLNLASNNNLNYSAANLFKNAGYTTYAFHNNSYTYYKRNITHKALGFNWYGCGGKATDEDGWEDFKLENHLTNSWPRSDCELVNATLSRVCDDFILTKKPFLAYYLTVSGHNNYGYDVNAMSRKNWDKVVNFDCSDTLKAYFACQLELEYALENMISVLKEKDVLNDTVIVLINDHYPYGLEKSWSTNNGKDYLSELIGANEYNEFEKERGSFIVWCNDMNEAVIISKPTCGFDVLPTLLNLFGIEYDSRLFVGRDALSDCSGLVFFGNMSFIYDKMSYQSEKNSYSSYNQIEKTYKEEITDEILRKIHYSKLARQKNFIDFVFDNN